MILLTLGLVIFFAAHSLPMFAPLRTELLKRYGDDRYKGIFSAVAGIGFALIVIGYAYTPRGEPLFPPVAEAKQLAPFAMVVCFILLAAANMKGYLRQILQHPMLLGVGIWATIHLLANGHLKATVLFGAFLVYAAIDLISAFQRGANKTFEVQTKHDIIAIGGGTVMALIVMALHRMVIGVPVVTWGL